MNYRNITETPDDTPHILIETANILFKGDHWKSNLTKSILQSTGWQSSFTNLEWILKHTYFNRFYVQMKINVNYSLLPTPTCLDGVSNKGRKITMEKGVPKNISKNGARYGIKISQLASIGLLPTPSGRLANSACNQDRGKGNLEDIITRVKVTESIQPGLVNPGFIQEMMGFPRSWLISPFKIKN